MSFDPYEHLRDSEIDEMQWQSWVVDTEPNAGPPNRQRVLLAADAIGIAHEFLDGLARDVAISSRWSYLPGARLFLARPEDPLQPLGGYFDIPAHYNFNAGNLVQEIVNDFVPNEAALSTFWSQAQTYNDQEGGADEPVLIQELLSGAPIAPTPRTIPWWQRPAAEPTRPHAPSPPTQPRGRPGGAGASVAVALGAIEILGHIIRGWENLSDPTPDPLPQDENIAQIYKIEVEDAVRARTRRSRCLERYESDMSYCQRWLRRVTDANNNVGWGMPTTDTAPRHTRSFMSRA